MPLKICSLGIQTLHKLETNRPHGNGGQIGRREECPEQQRERSRRTELGPDRSEGGEIWRTKGRNVRPKTVHAGEKGEPEDKIRVEKGQK